MTNIMPSDVAIVALCAEIYEPTAIAGAFDYYDAGLCWAIKRLDGFADLGVFAWHHFGLYQAALAVLDSQEGVA
jgi:hypothetical protein